MSTTVNLLCVVPVRAGLIILLLAPRIAVSACPPGDGAFPFSRDGIELRFGSEIQPATTGQYSFVRCVSGGTEDSVFVDWRKAGPAGQVSSTKGIINSIASNTNEHKSVRSVAYVGPFRHRTYPGYERSIEETNALYRLAASVLKSVIEIWPQESEDDKKNNETPINAEFSSSVTTANESNFRYTYSWKEREVEISRKIQWGSEYMRSNLDDPLLPLSLDANSIEFEHEAPPVYRVIIVDIYSEEERYLGSGAVGIYVPGDFTD